MSKLIKSQLFWLVLPFVAIALGYIAGTSAGDEIAAQAARQHNLCVVAAVEAAAARYSVYVDDTYRADYNLYPELNTPRIPMSDLDDYYR